MLDYFPNADHAGIYAAQAAGEFERAGLDVEIVRRRPTRPRRCSCCRRARPTSRSPTSPSCCSRATRARALVSVGALVQKPLTSLMAIGDARVDRASATCGQDGRHGRHPVPVGLPRSRSSRGGRRRRRQGGRRRLQPRRRRCSPARSTRRSARSGTTRAPTSSGAAATRRSCAWSSLGVPTYNELIFVARQRRRSTTRGRRRASGASCRRSRAAHRSVRDDPESARRRAAGGQPRPRARAAGRRRRGHRRRCSSPRTTSGPSGFQDLAEWRAYGDWMFENELLDKHAPTADDASPTSSCPGQGLKPDATTRPESLMRIARHGEPQRAGSPAAGGRERRRYSPARPFHSP